MALSNLVNWEVRTTGNDTNGGGFHIGASGTDWSQQTSPQYSVTDGVTAGTTTITSVSASFGTDVVGNIIYVSGGTGSITGAWYEIISRTNSTTIVVDRSTGLSVGTGATLKIGGALLTPQQGLTNLTADQVLWIKTGTYTITSALTMSVSASNLATRVFGYGTSRGDTGMATISQTAAAKGILANQNGFQFSNLILDGTSTGTLGFDASSASFGGISNCTIKNWTAGGLSMGGNYFATNVEVASTTGATACINANGQKFSYCYIHNNSVGINDGSSTYDHCIISNNTGYGISSNGFIQLTNCLCYGNTGDGITLQSIYSPVLGTTIKNNIFAKNGGYGINGSGGAQPSLTKFPNIDYNGFWSNTSGAMNNISNYGNSVLITGSSPTNDPFVNDGSGNFALNSTAGAGALLQNAGFPGSVIGLGTTVGYEDIGPFRHQDPSGGGNTYIFPQFD